MATWRAAKVSWCIRKSMRKHDDKLSDLQPLGVDPFSEISLGAAHVPRPNPEIKSVSYLVRTRSNSSPSWSNSTSYNEDYNRSWTGTVSPGYPGVLRTNPHLMHLRKARRRPDFRIYLNNGFGTWSEYVGPQRNYTAGYPDPGVDSLAALSMADEVRQTARSRIISKVSRQKVNIAQNVGEYRQVQGMFMSNTRRLADAYRALRRGDIRGLQRNLSLTRKQERGVGGLARDQLVRNPSAWWLELQYGWLPLVGDVYDGMTEFYRRVEQGIVIRERASATRKWDASAPAVGNSQYFEYSRDTSRKAVCKTGLSYRVDSSRLANLQDWGVLNPLLLAWELMPYSFVVDWFLPVGDWLATVDYSLGLSFVEGFESFMVRAESRRVYKPKAPPPSLPNAKWECSGDDTFEEYAFQRVKLSSFPTAPLPSFQRDGLRGKRIANALALLGVAFGRR